MAKPRNNITKLSWESRQRLFEILFADGGEYGDVRNDKAIECECLSKNLDLHSASFGAYMKGAEYQTLCHKAWDVFMARLINRKMEECGMKAGMNEPSAKRLESCGTMSGLLSKSSAYAEVILECSEFRRIIEAVQALAQEAGCKDQAYLDALDVVREKLGGGKPCGRVYIEPLLCAHRVKFERIQDTPPPLPKE